MSHGKRLLELVGEELGPAAWTLVDQPMIDTFARATLDDQWIHVDPERAARESPFGTTIAHGMLTLSLVPGQVIEILELADAPLVINYGLGKVRFPAPVVAGTRIRTRLTVVNVDEVKGGVRATLDAVVENDRQERPVCVAQLILQVNEG